MQRDLLEVETLSYSKPGQPPRPVTFRFLVHSKYMQGTVKKVRYWKTETQMGNLRYTYLCDAEIEDRVTTVKMQYERDSMKWFLYNL